MIAEVRRLENVDGLRSGAQVRADALTGETSTDDADRGQLCSQAARTLLEVTGRRSLSKPSPPDCSGVRGAGRRRLRSVRLPVRTGRRPGACWRSCARQSALRSLTRRYGEDVDAVLAWAR